jgi:histidyl-tRNA synthetase
VYLVMAGSGSVPAGLQLAERLRGAVPRLRIQSNLGGGSFKSQFKRADRSGARLALVLGEDELAEGAATVKHLRDEASRQERVSLDGLPQWFEKWLRD